ncbi:terminase large subunit domain-containing protein [Senegalia massiliensis]|uniref:PBSX family phage terminase large subunit n=1 Tax=Senegalia massiliensis TaxID=1720316 RepID=A0A845R6F6_9CLOT|nr:terminase family protein [Senegalia massiliensis]NBI08073.1 PBSX family phage terminase large subunit [Senegalia massiliensis]
MAITKTKTINWGFGEKHKEYIRNCKYNTINVAEGAVRAGKTIDNVFAFAMELERTPDKIHLATGSTAANAKLNIGEANGFGLEYIFRGRSRWGKFKDNECIYVKTMTGEKIVIFAGGAKADSFKKIRGNSYGMWIATEINLHHDNTIKEAFNRQLMAKNRKIFWDLNPSKPKHQIYTEYIDLYKKKQEEAELVGGYNYQHFTIFDNINLTEQRIAEIISQYDKNSIWYQRDIIGKRMIAEGLIYRQFATNPKKYRTDKAKRNYMSINIGIDFGGNESKHAFVATGITRGYKEVVILESERYETDVDPDGLNQLFIDFVKRIINKYGKVNYVYPDNNEQVLIRGFKNVAKKERLNITIRDSKKIPIVDRIRLVTSLMAQGRFSYTQNAETVEDALTNAVWDSETDELKRLDDGTSDIDTLDALEYSIERDAKRFINQ